MLTRLPLACALVVVLTAPGATQDNSGHDWSRFGWDASRSSSPLDPTGIDASNAGSLRRQQVTIDGTVDASPIYLHGVRVSGAAHDVFFVTTTYGKTLAIDAANGAILWRFTPPGYDGWAGSRQITNTTPVADPDRQFIYAASPDGKIQKLAVADGHSVWRTSITKLPAVEKIASSLNYFRGNVLATVGGYIGDAPPYQGHVAIIDGATGRLLHVWNALCSDRHELIDPSSCSESGAAIWGRAGAVIDTSTGNILVATGNGKWDGKTNWGDATLELSADAAHIVANYTPTNTDELDQHDIDVGSTSPVLLDARYLAQGGKDGKIMLLNRKRISGDAAHRGGETQTVGTPSSARLFSAPAVAGTTAPALVAADKGGIAGWQLSDGRLVPSFQIGAQGGTSPVIAGGLLYVYDPAGKLLIYSGAHFEHQVAALECGKGHWNSPIVVDGRVALPEGNANDHASTGILNIWRLH
jgi:outer membrane protein assembly factor BamB